MICTLCSCELVDRLDNKYFCCSQCGGYVMDEACFLSPEEEKERYESHNNDVHDERYREFTYPIVEQILSKYNASHVGLDYGCGSGPVVAKVLDENGYQVKLFDPFFYPDTDYRNFKYDYIFSCEVFEHFFNPRKEICDLVDLLKVGGRLIIMTHLYSDKIDFENWYYRNDPTHVFIYTKKTIEFVADLFDLKIEILTDRLIVFVKQSLQDF